MKKIVILGCTGSIGDTSFRVLENLGQEYRVVGLSGGARLDKLVERVRAWKPRLACVATTADQEVMRQALPGVEVLCGQEGLCALAALEEADVVLNALVGAVGLRPTLAALEAGKVVAMANKEPLVMAGGLLLEKARRHGGTILPLDSEPNAIWQCLKGGECRHLRRIILTASGGPFYGWTQAQMRHIAPAQALDHPTWKMGPKISVDSATLMNKGFEVIEAGWLFGVDLGQVEVVIHRQSVVHSLVELVDGALLAHLGKADMLLPIQYALTHPERRPAPVERLDLERLGQLSFAAVDRESFPGLELCYQAGRRGGTAPAALNAANEVAVQGFLEGEIGFLDIAALNRHVLDLDEAAPAEELEVVLEADARARQRARAWLEAQ